MDPQIPGQLNTTPNLLSFTSCTTTPHSCFPNSAHAIHSSEFAPAFLSSFIKPSPAALLHEAALIHPTALLTCDLWSQPSIRWPGLLHSIHSTHQALLNPTLCQDRCSEWRGRRLITSRLQSVCCGSPHSKLVKKRSIPRPTPALLTDSV